MIEDVKQDKSLLLEEFQALKAVNSIMEDVLTLSLERPVVVFRWSTSKGWPIEYVSPNVSDIFGYSVDEICARRGGYAELIASSDLERVSTEVERAVREGVQTFDNTPYRIVRRDGTECFIYEHTKVVRNDNNEVDNFYGYVFEVPQQKTVENELVNTDVLSQTILDNTNTVVYVKDLNGCYLHINGRYEELFKILRDDIIGKSDHDLFSTQIADTVRANDIQVKELDRLIEFEEQVTQGDGIQTYISTKFPMHDKKGKVYAVCGISTDITERKCREKELIEAAQNNLLELRELRETEKRLGGALETGNLVNVVVGILMERYRLERQDAFDLLRKKARTERRKIKDVAKEILESWDALNQLLPENPQ